MHYRVAPPSNCLQWYLEVGRHDSDRRNTIDCQDVKNRRMENVAQVENSLKALKLLLATILRKPVLLVICY